MFHKANQTVPAEELNLLFTPTKEEIQNHPSLIKPDDQITGFYRGVLKCYQDAESRFYLWY